MMPQVSMAAIGGGLNEQAAKAVVPDLPDHCSGAAVFLQCSEKIAGRAAGWAFSVGYPAASAATGQSQ